MESAGKYWIPVFNLLEDEINDVDREIESLISSDPDYENAIRFLMTIPGVKRDSAIA